LFDVWHRLWHKGKPGIDGVSAYVTTTFNKPLQNKENRAESKGVLGDGRDFLHEMSRARRRAFGDVSH